MTQNNNGKITKISIYFLLVSGSVIMIIPLIWMIRSSFMGMQQIFIFPPEWIPTPWVFTNYPEALTTVPFIQYFLNTITILIPSVLGTLVTASMAAFAFARLKWPGKNFVFAVLMTTLMLPYAVTLIPTFLIWAKLGLINTYWPLILPKWFGGGIFYIFLLRQFFLTIPKELDEAATIDWANHFQILWHFMFQRFWTSTPIRHPRYS